MQCSAVYSQTHERLILLKHFFYFRWFTKLAGLSPSFLSFPLLSLLLSSPLLSFRNLSSSIRLFFYFFTLPGWGSECNGGRADRGLEGRYGGPVHDLHLVACIREGFFLYNLIM